MKLAAQAASVALGGLRVLNELSCAFDPGELVAVIGANGAGKSTALRMLSGLVKPDEGHVRLEGQALASYDRAELGRCIAYLPQDRTVHWGLDAERVVALGRLPHKRYASALDDKDHKAVTAAMARMDIAHLARRSITTLSGGERARVLVARALAQDTAVLIADEPTAGLDPAHTLALFEEFKRLAAGGACVVTALHDLSLAARYATRVMLLKDGRCIADGPPGQVLSSFNLATVFAVDAVVAEVHGLPVVLPRSALNPSRPLT